MNLSDRNFTFSVFFLFWCVQEIMAQHQNLTHDWALGPLYNANEAYCKIQNRFLYSAGVTGYVIIKDGVVAAEGYKHEEDAEGKTQVFSVTKSWSTMLIGILSDKGLINITSTLGDIFSVEKDWEGVEQADEKKQVTLFELLTMSSGLREQGEQEDYYLNSTLNALYYDENEVGKFEYLASNHILSRIIYRTSGMTPRELAIDSGIFAALGIDEDDFLWDTFDGIEGSAYGLHLSPRTLAKLGMLYLQDGYVAEGVSMISSDWVSESIKNHAREEDDPYGFQWYPGIYNRSGSFGARGLFGNHLFCFPDMNIVIAITADANILSSYFFSDMVMKYVGKIGIESDSCHGSFFLGAIIDLSEYYLSYLPYFFSLESFPFLFFFMLVIVTWRLTALFGFGFTIIEVFDIFT